MSQVHWYGPWVVEIGSATLPEGSASLNRQEPYRLAHNKSSKSSVIYSQEEAGKMVSPKKFDAELFLTTVGPGRTIATYKPKKFIFRQGAKCDAVFYIQNGHVELVVVSEQGKERVVGPLGPGAFIYEGALAGHPRYLASARASTEAILARVEIETMR
jgi:CRP-like cAMP-binding protein